MKVLIKREVGEVKDTRRIKREEVGRGEETGARTVVARGRDEKGGGGGRRAKRPGAENRAGDHWRRAPPRRERQAEWIQE